MCRCLCPFGAVWDACGVLNIQGAFTVACIGVGAFILGAIIGRSAWLMYTSTEDYAHDVFMDMNFWKVDMLSVLFGFLALMTLLLIALVIWWIVFAINWRRPPEKVPKGKTRRFKRVYYEVQGSSDEEPKEKTVDGIKYAPLTKRHA